VPTSDARKKPQVTLGYTKESNGTDVTIENMEWCFGLLVFFFCLSYSPKELKTADSDNNKAALRWFKLCLLPEDKLLESEC